MAVKKRPKTTATKRVAKKRAETRSKRSTRRRIPTTAARPSAQGINPWFDFFASYDGRYIGRNAFISGTYADDGPQGWNNVREIAAKRGVTEWALGGSVGAARGSFTAQVVTRSGEYEPTGGRHRFGSVSLTLFTRGSARR